MISWLYSKLDRNGYRSYHNNTLPYIWGKNSKGTQILPLYLLVKTLYLYPKELPLDTPSNRSPTGPQRCLKGITGRELSSGWGELLPILPPCQRHDPTESCWLLFHWKTSTWNEICFWSTNKFVHAQITIFFYLNY